MRICLVSYEFLPRTGGGGAGALYTDLATGLSRGGHEVTVIAGNVGNRTEMESSKNLKIVRIGGMQFPHNGSYGQLLMRLIHVARYLRSEMSNGAEFDIIEAPEFRGETYLASLVNRNVPFLTRLVTPHFKVAEINERRTDPLIDQIEKRNALLSRLLLTDSEQWGREIIDRWSIPEERLVVCPVGIDVDRVDNAKNVAIPVAEPYILFSGKLTLAKGPQILASAAPEILQAHPEVKIVFVGADTYDRRGRSIRELMLASTPEEYSKKFVFLGHVASWDMLVSLYRNASVCVKADSMGNHSYDALGQMACAKPMVCSKTEGYMDMIVGGSNGFLFDRSQPSDLAGKVVALLADRQLAMTISRRARETIEDKFSASRFASETSRIYEHILAPS